MFTIATITHGIYKVWASNLRLCWYRWNSSMFSIYPSAPSQYSVTPRNPRGQHAESGPQPLQNPEPAGNQSWWWACDVMTQNPSAESGQHSKFWANHRAAQKSTTYHSWVCVCVNMQYIPQVNAIFTRGFPHFFRQTQLVIKNIPLWGAGFSNTTVSIGSGICLGAELLLLAAQLTAQ
jgi:hypothetical protein